MANVFSIILLFFFFFLNRLAEQLLVNMSLRAEVQMLTTSITELKALNSCLRDEHTALQLAFASLEDKLRKVQVRQCGGLSLMYKVCRLKEIGSTNSNGKYIIEIIQEVPDLSQFSCALILKIKEMKA